MLKKVVQKFDWRQVWFSIFKLFIAKLFEKFDLHQSMPLLTAFIYNRADRGLHISFSLNSSYFFDWNILTI